MATTLQYSRRFLMSLNGWWKIGATSTTQLIRGPPLSPSTWSNLKSFGLLRKMRGLRAGKYSQEKSLTHSRKLNYSTSNDCEIPVITSESRRERIYHKQEVAPRSFLTPIKLSKPPPSRPRTHPKCLVLNARSLATKPYAVEGLREELKTNAVVFALFLRHG